MKIGSFTLAVLFLALLQPRSGAQESDADALPNDNSSPVADAPEEATAPDQIGIPDVNHESPRPGTPESPRGRGSPSSRQNGPGRPDGGRLPPNPGGRSDRNGFRSPSARGDSPRFGDRRTPPPSFSSNSADSEVPGSTNRLDYAAYKLIADRNIFNLFRSPRSAQAPRESRRPARIDTLTLVGTLSSEKGDFAFFDGTSSEFRKALSLGKNIAGYKVTSIGANSVQMAAGTNQVDLEIGMQMRREEGAWRIVGKTRARSEGPGFANDAATEVSSADDTDIVKRLMQQRESELK